MPDRRPSTIPVAFGPELPGWGSWNWVGLDLMRGLSDEFQTQTFAAWELPHTDLILIVKHAPPLEWAEKVARRSRLIYAPVDYYSSIRAIDEDRPLLRLCSLVIVHCERLRRYFEPYTPVKYLDHHIKFTAPLREEYQPAGSLLWIGVRSNLAPVVSWINEHSLPFALDVLTNLENPDDVPSPEELGFMTGANVAIHNWSVDKHIALLGSARACLDIKGDDFRARHKPPAKALDVIASGVPFAINEDSSTAEHLNGLGFQIASPLVSSAE